MSEPYSKPVRLGVAIPTIHQLPVYFFESFISSNRPPQTFVFIVEGKPLDIARTRLAKRILETEATHILWLDSDMKFPPSAVSALLRRDLDIVSATYYQRTDMPQPHVYDFHHEDEDGTTWYRTKGKELMEWMHKHPEVMDVPNNWNFPHDDGLVECDAVGFGCVLIKREVFEKTPEPWFDIDMETGGGEDMWFCRQAKKAGFKIHADFNVQCDHEGKGAFIGRAEFADTWAFGTPDEYNWDGDPVLVEVTPRGRQYKTLTRPRNLVRMV